MSAPTTTTPSQTASELTGFNPKEPEWNHEECAAYEAARECIVELMAHCNARIYLEKARSSPDKSALDRLERQAHDFIEETRSLALKAHERIALIRRVYGAKCRRLMVDPNARD